MAPTPDSGDRGETLSLKVQGFQPTILDTQKESTVKAEKKERTLTTATCNPYIKTFKDMEYAARGPVILRAVEIERELAQGVRKPFKEVIKANLGDAQAMGQSPITFIRQVISLVTHQGSQTESSCPSDVADRAEAILSQCRGNTAGSYTDSKGILGVRRSVAEYIKRRDGHPSNPEDIVITSGASEGIRSCLKLFKSPEGVEQGRSGILLPVPEYPLYSATVGEFNIAKVPYYLNEEKGWAISIPELKRAILSAKNKGIAVRAVVVINPGNPTGHVLSRKNMEEMVRFAYEEGLVILADEVYQDNVYRPKVFHSFNKVVKELPCPYNETELISFYSCSKGFVCECGLRGGYFEMTNIDPDVKSIVHACAAAKLCPSVLGQALVEVAVNPPKEDEPSFPLYMAEKQNILNNLEEKAVFLSRELNSIPRISCPEIEGAMYAFPKVDLPEPFVQQCQELGQTPDVQYALALLEETGICVVPGSGIGQAEGTWHFRVTILPSMAQLTEMMERFKKFHTEFLLRFDEEKC